MASSKNDIPKNQSVPKNIMGKADTSEGEIDLIDYFRVLWKRRYFIFLFAVLPVLIVFLILIFLPKDYEITYIYDTWLDKEPYKALSGEFENIEDLYQFQAQSEDKLSEKNRRILLDEFHSAENLDKLTAKLKENRLDKYAQKMARENVRLEVSGTSLAMTIVGRPKKDMQRISLVVRDNFEKVIPIYSVKKELISAIAKFKAEMADIEENKFSLELELQKKKAILAKLKDLEPADSNKIPGNIILQFDNISENSEYLPLAYQVQITDANIINIEETIKANQEKYNYYKSLISLNERLFDEVKNKTSSYYTIQEFHSFLTGIVNDYEDKKLVDCLNAYIKKIENVTSTNIPVVEEPSVHLVPKDIVKKIVVLFVALLLIMTLVAFLLEAVQQRQAPTS